VYAPLVSRSKNLLAGLTKLIVPEHVVGQVRAHASTARKGWEVGGRLVVTAGTVTGYTRVRNHADRPGRFVRRSSWLPGPGEAGINLHSHPGKLATPSRDDLSNAREHGEPIVAIYHAPTGTLGVFAPVTDDKFRRIPVHVVAASRPAQVVELDFVPTPRPRRSVLIDVERRRVLTSSGQLIPGGWPKFQRFARTRGL
jgi:proteasome lid subunit RPN8/RPN11